MASLAVSGGRLDRTQLRAVHEAAFGPVNAESRLPSPEDGLVSGPVARPNEEEEEEEEEEHVILASPTAMYHEDEAQRDVLATLQ